MSDKAFEAHRRTDVHSGQRCIVFLAHLHGHTQCRVRIRARIVGNSKVFYSHDYSPISTLAPANVPPVATLSQNHNELSAVSRPEARCMVDIGDTQTPVDNDHFSRLRGCERERPFLGPVAWRKEKRRKAEENRRSDSAVESETVGCSLEERFHGSIFSNFPEWIIPRVIISMDQNIQCQ
jgi:hypothetical protein